MKHIALRQQITDSPWTYPGGYPKYGITDDGGLICKDCCCKEHEVMDSSNPKDGWHLEAISINWEDVLFCDHCSNPIESAYPTEGESNVEN